VLGLPIGIGMAIISTRVLNPLFTLATSVALAASLLTVARLRAVSVLRET